MGAAEKKGTHTWDEQDAAIGHAKTTADLLNAIGLTSNQVASIAGANAPSARNVLATMNDIPTVLTFGTVAGTACQGNDARIPTSDQKAALGGTSGTAVSASNKLVDNADTRMTDSRTPKTHAASHAAAGSDPITTTAIGAVPTSRTVNGHALTGDVTVTKSDVGLGNVDNTADANKPVSTAQATAIAAQTFSAVALTNPYSATPALTPRRIGDRAYNTTSLEWWDGIATAGATTSWQLAASGGGGSGDMTKAVYDTVNRGYVDRAVLADTATTAGTISGSITISQVTNLSSELSATIEEAPIDGTSYARKDAGWVSLPDFGDMFKSVYDTDNDGKVDAAEVADSATYAATAGTISGTTTLSHISDAGTAAAQNVGYFATAAQGTKADTALQANQTITLSGDATGSGTTAITVTLANTGVSAGSYGSATAVPAITVNAKGLTTAVTSTPIQIAESQVTDLTTDLAAQATAITAQVFAELALTNPYSATTPLTPRYLGDIAINSTSLEIWAANSVTGATTSWEVAAQGPYGGTLVTDVHAITKNGFYSAVSTASNLPTSDESYYLSALCSNLSTTSAVITAIGLTSGKMWMKRKVSSVWGSWFGGVTSQELAYVIGVTSAIQPQLDAKANITHSSTHATGGDDEITPVAIGAAAAAQGALADTAVQPTGTPVANQLAYWTTAQILAASTVTTTELEALTGINGNVQAQLDGKLTAANNLSDLTNSATALENLGMNYLCWPQEMPDSGRFSTLTDQKQINLPSASYTASTLSIVGATATITDSAGRIPTASFPVNMTMVTMSGWTNAANNAVQLRVSSVSATTLVLEGDGAETLVDESAGASITLRGVTLSNTSGFFNPYAGAAVKATGVALYDNSTRGGTGGALSPSVLSLLLAMSPAYPWRYMVEFGVIKITSASATNPSYMFLNDRKAHFANFSNIGCFGYWARAVGSLRPVIYGWVSIDGAPYSYTTQYTFPDNNWHYIKAFKTSASGYDSVHAGIIYSTAAGQEVEIACPFFTGCVPLSSLKWTSVLAKK